MTPLQLAPESVTSPESVSPAQWRGPLFVAGTWRSGTSLLYALLNKHPQISLMYEADLFLLRPSFWMPGAASKRLARWDLWNGALRRHSLDSGQIPTTGSRFPVAMKDAYQEYARMKGAQIWGDKSVAFYHTLDRLVRDFPDARVIFLWRDLADICRSIFRAKKAEPFISVRGVTRTIMRHKALKEQCDYLVSLGFPVHQIQYETMIKDPTNVMADVCRFLGLPFVPAMASLKGADRSAIHEGKHHALVNSERIVSSHERSEVLPTQVKRKIERYVALWHEESGGTWPAFPPPQNSDSRKPSLRERLVDQALFRCMRTFESTVAIFFCFAPFWFLKGYRAYKRRILGHNLEV